MKDLKLKLIETLVAWLLSKDSYEFIKRTVTTVASFDLSGEEKRKEVQRLIAPQLSGIASILVNLGIEIAVNSITD